MTHDKGARALGGLAVEQCPVPMYGELVSRRMMRSRALCGVVLAGVVSGLAVSSLASAQETAPDDAAAAEAAPEETAPDEAAAAEATPAEDNREGEAAPSPTAEEPSNPNEAASPDEATVSEESAPADKTEVDGDDANLGSPGEERPAADAGPSGGASTEAEGPALSEGSETERKWDEGLDHSGTPKGPPAEEEPTGDEGGGEAADDIDGRKDKIKADDVLIWIPRGILYPVHAVLNYVVRYPIVKGLEKAEEHHVPEKVQNVFTFADDKAGIFPVAFYDAGRGFWGGLNFYWNDLGREGHRLAATGGYGTSGWIGVNIRDKWDVFEDASGEFDYGASFIRNPNNAYAGVGPDTAHEDLVFFEEEKWEGYLNLKTKLHGLNRFKSGFSFKNSRLGDGRDPGIESGDSTFDTTGLTGFDSAFWLMTFRIALDLDTRYPRVENTRGSGARLETWLNYNYGPGKTRLSFLKYGAHPKAIWDITGSNHVLTLGLYTEALSKTGGEDVPLSELVALGGDHLRGFIRGRFRGESAWVYNLEYEWPLLAFADAFLFSEIGNTYNGFFEDFSHKNMVLNWGTGVKTSFSQDFKFFLAVGFGSNQFDQMGADGFQVDKVRFYAGATRDF